MRLIGVHNPTRVRSKGIFLFFLFLFLFYFSILVFWISPFGFSNFWIFLKISHFSYFAPVSPSSPPHLTFQPWESLHFLFYFIFYLQFFFLIQFRFQFFAFWTWIFQNFLFSKSDSDTAPSPPISSFPLHSLYYVFVTPQIVVSRFLFSSFFPSCFITSPQTLLDYLVLQHTEPSALSAHHSDPDRPSIPIRVFDRR